MPSRNASMALVRSSWSGEGQVGAISVIAGVWGVVASQAGQRVRRGAAIAAGTMPTHAPPTFAPMDGHRLNPLEQQVLMDGVYICLLLGKDEHLSRQANPSWGLPLPSIPHLPQSAAPTAPPLILGVLGQLGWPHSRAGVSFAGTRAGTPSWPPPSHIPPPAITGARLGGPEDRLTSHGPTHGPGQEVITSLLPPRAGHPKNVPC